MIFFYFVFIIFSINGTNTDRLARYVNDSPRRFANCVPKAFFMLGKPRVLIFALCDSGTELRYDYGGSALPWRQVIATYFL